jgi:hypothetical protein
MTEFSHRLDDLDGIRDTATRFGFCIIKGVFSTAEMEDFEQRMGRATQGGGVVPDLMSLDSLRPVLLDPRIIRVAKAVLGDSLVYYGETALNYEATPAGLTHNPFRAFHADARGTPEDLEATWNTPPGQVYQGYRFAIYFRDYSKACGGLKVAPGSHVGDRKTYEVAVGNRLFGLPRRKFMLNAEQTIEIPVPKFDLYNLSNEPGDLVIFNLRTFHSAGALRFRDRPTLAILPEAEARLLDTHRELFVGYPEKPRNALFFDYASQGSEIDLYIKWRAWKLIKSTRRRLGAAAKYGHEVASPGLFQFDRPQVVSEAGASGVSMRCDKIIAALAASLGWGLPQNAAPKLSDQDTATITHRLEQLLAAHTEYMPHHSLLGRAGGRDDSMARLRETITQQMGD